MGYELHVTRRKLWFGEGDDIRLEEFVRYVRDDGEFRYPGDNGEHYAEWRYSKNGGESWLCWSDGQIHTKNPEPDLIVKMVAMACELGAKVQGDDGEVYSSATQIESNETEASTPVPDTNLPALSFLRWPLWKQLIAAFMLGCVLLALKLMLFE